VRLLTSHFATIKLNTGKSSYHESLQKKRFLLKKILFGSLAAAPKIYDFHVDIQSSKLISITEDFVYIFASFMWWKNS
jgi:hypothetical protein